MHPAQLGWADIPASRCWEYTVILAKVGERKEPFLAEVVLSMYLSRSVRCQRVKGFQADEVCFVELAVVWVTRVDE